MGLEWIHENPPRWDDDKQRIVGGAPAGSLPTMDHRPGMLIPGEWWRVESDGRTVGYGWMDTVMWGDAEILLAVAPEARERGIGSFIVEQLAREAADRGLRYMYNVVPADHPDHDAMARWLAARGFEKAHEDDRRMRRVGGS